MHTLTHIEFFIALAFDCPMLNEIKWNERKIATAAAAVVAIACIWIKSTVAIAYGRNKTNQKY